MQRRTFFTSLGLLLAGLGAGWALDGRGKVVGDAAAVEQTYGRGFFAGAPHLWAAPGGASFDVRAIGIAADHVAARLDLDDAQQARFDRLLEAMAAAFEAAKTDPDFDPTAIRAQALPDQLASLRTLARKADELLASLEPPLADFHASLDADQRQTLDAMIAEHRGGGRERGGWWHRRG